MSDQDRYIPGVPCWVDINCPDPEAAVAFYGGLFGWEFEDVTPPGAPFRYLLASLPGGAVAGVASQPDGTHRAVAWDTYVWVADADETAGRVRAAGGSVPERFEDVVASVAQSADDTPPHWGVTFGVDDADAIAARATQLGGRVLADPFDAPWVRMTVIADPQGATFIASKFTPENKDMAESGKATGST